MGKLYWKKVMEKRTQYNRMMYIVCILVLGISYFFILGEDGPYLSRDSETFINPNALVVQSYWLYTFFLSICRMLGGTERYLYIVYIFQGLFGMLSSVILTEFFRKYYKIGYVGALFIYILTLLPYGYSLPENVVSHHIMTEGLSIPLFHICILFTCKGVLEKKYRYMLLALLTGFLLVLTRSQLLVFIPSVLLLLLMAFAKKNIVRLSERMRMKSGLIIVVFVFVSIMTCIFFVKSFLLKTNIGSQFMVAVSGRVMCMMEYQDRELFEGEMQEIYDALYENANQGGHIKKYFRTDSWRSYDIAVHTNENAKEWPTVLKKFYSTKYPEKEEGEYKLKLYSSMEYIVATLCSKHIFEYLFMSIHLMVQSFVASVFIQPDSIRNLCYVITLLIYVGTFAVIYIAERKMKVEKKYIIPSLITLLFLITNVVFTNIIFYGLQRYVVYTFGMFYVSWFIMLVGMVRKWKNSDKTRL